VRIFGDGKYADRLEQIAYNALPAAWNRDLTVLRYYTLANHVIAKRGGQGFGQNYDNGIVYGPRSGYPCCCFNVHQGWPKLVQNSWAATSDNGLAPLVYAPNTVTAKVGGGATATIVQETLYPLQETVRFKVTMTAAATFPLTLRTPAWCEQPSLTVNGEPVEPAKPGMFVRIARKWSTGDEVMLKLPMSARVQRGVHNSVSIHRGPLVYCLRIDDEKRVVGQPATGFDEFEQIPKTEWNYALSIDEKNPRKSFELLVDGSAPADISVFAPATPPVKILATARKLPKWGLAWNGVVAFDPPASPVQSDEPDERIALVPFGSAELRVTDFPVLGNPTRNIVESLSFNFDDDHSNAWSWIGGGWWTHRGKLRTTPTGGAPGFKALLEGAEYADLLVQADVTPPPVGDAGVIFRVSNPSIGADAYEGYYAGVSASSNQVMLGRADGKKWIPLKVVGHRIGADNSTTLRVTARGARIDVTLNDQAKPIISINDEKWLRGQVGVRMYTTDNDGAVSAFDNVNVTRLLPSP
jgi:Beta-L-arabinofuranosidase, GH127